MKLQQRRTLHIGSFLSLLGLALVFVVVWVGGVRAASVYIIPDRTAVFPLNKYSMAVNGTNPVLSYYSQYTQNMVLAACANPACTTSSINQIEDVVPQGVSVTILNGNPLVAYTENDSGAKSRLKVAVCSDPACAQAPTIHTLDDNRYMQHVSITLQNGLPVIAYDELTDDSSQNIVKLAICTDATCSGTPIIRAFDASAGINGAGGIGVGIANGNPVVGYVTRLRGLRMLTCATPTCSDTPLIQTIEPDGANAWAISMAVVDSTVVMSYAVDDPASSFYMLKVAACTDSSCMDTPNIHFIDQIFGGSTSIIGVNHLPMIVYTKFNINAYNYYDIRIATCLDVFCNYSYGTSIARSTYTLPLIQASGIHPVVGFAADFQAAFPPNINIYYGGDYAPNPSLTPTKTPLVTLTPSPTQIPPNGATQTVFAALFASFTPSITPTPSQTPTATATPTLITPTTPPNSTPGPHFFAMRHPTLTWSRITWALGYQLEIDDDPNFGSPIPVPDEFSANILSYTTENELADGLYYWHVRAKKNAIDWGDWSATETMIVSAP